MAVARNSKANTIEGDISFSSTMHVIVPCEQGQTVWVAAGIGGCRVDDTGSHFNQFSGLLIKRGLE